jgi:hypothetical protein
MPIKKSTFSESVTRHDELRSLDKWPSANFRWVTLGEFLDSPQLESGIHSILLDGGLVFDVYIDIKINAPAYVYFHGNCPRAPHFKLPVFSGANVLESLTVTRIVPSDPVLLMDPSLELSWHAGNADCNLQEIYKAVFNKVVTFAASPEIVFWGGSGGGFAALYYSFFFPGSTAMVWNPQINFLEYSEDAVNKYLNTAFGTALSDSTPITSGIEHDLAKLYRRGYKNRIIYIQNNEDWHVETHLVPFLNALGVDSVVFPTAHSGLVLPNVYLFLGRFSKGHEPPTNVEIHCALQECYSTHGDPARFNFARLITGRHHTSKTCPSWVMSALTKRSLAYFRPDWPHPGANPTVNAASPYSIKLSTGVVIDASLEGCIDWGVVFEKDPSDNIHELYSLGYVGRLLSSFDSTRSQEPLDAAIEILRSFCAYIEDASSYELVMTNRGYSSADHSISIRANVLIKFLQIVINNEALHSENWSLMDAAISHLWNIGDHFTNARNIYPSNHGIMSCLTLAQISNQFGNLRYISEHYLRLSNAFLTGLVRSSFDRDGWCNENTVGYHSFICRLLRDYVEYCSKNKLLMQESDVLERFLRKGEQALSYCVRQDGSIPPIGDSPLYRSQLSSINSSKFFPESGFLVIKDDALHLSLICGSRSDNHKQADDSSIALHYGGEDLIIDGGSYCYDYNDPHRRYLVSFRGHSGLFPEAAADISPKAYLMHRKYAQIDEYAESASGRFAKARYGLDLDSFECERRILVDYSGGVIIADRASSSNPKTVFNQSFLLAPQLKLVQRLDNYLVFEGDKYGIIISQINPSKLSIETGSMDPVVAGWHSVDWRKIERTSQLRFSQHGLTAHYLTRLQIFEKGRRDAQISLHELPKALDLMEIYSR